MFPLALIIGMVVLLVALLVALVAIAILRRPRPVPAPRFAEEFIGELTRLNDEPGLVVEELLQPGSTEQHLVVQRLVEQKNAYALHKEGEPVFRIASKLGISKADAELLIQIEDRLNRTTTETEVG